MQRFRTIYYVVAMVFFTICMFFVFALFWVLTVPFDRNRALMHRISRCWSKAIYRLSPWWKVEVRGMENIRPGTAYIVVSNHQAMLDIPLLYWLPFNFKWVSKREVYKIPIFGWVLWMHGDVTIDRGGAASTRKMMEECNDYLKRGVGVVLFPEGTRTKTGQIQNFKEGAMLLAAKSGAPVLPVVIDGTFDAFGQGGIKAPHRFRIEILPPIPAADIANSSVKELRDTLHTLMDDTHRRVAPGRYTDAPEDSGN